MLLLALVVKVVVCLTHSETEEVQHGNGQDTS
jgi:hypothetical protein